MKKIFTLSLMLCTTVFVNAQSTWSFGITASSLGNYSRFSGGMQQAHARYHHNIYGTAAIGFTARKQFNAHWGFQTGLGFSSIGFEEVITQNYSLLNPVSQYLVSRVSSVNAYVPATILYTTRLNCRNWRWFVGAGFSLVGSDKQTIHTTYLQDNSTAIPEQHFQSTGKAALHAHLLGGIEKVFKRGAILSLGVIVNSGTSAMATNDVMYTIDGTAYNHSFTNRGNYAGVYVSYYFKPKGNK